ncbi:cold shock protein [Theileria orientalis]|uniref:Cold shock protein n=1 Tax=Theileria orientalis TaxID=68886 RepID=A0A976M5C3_THEOR|nr:cold shock protein [Theileria orientalis]
MARLSGTCKWFNSKKGYGFITLDNGEDVFVHQSEIYADGFRSLRENEKVELEVVLENDRKKAIHVTGPEGDYVMGSQNELFRSNRNRYQGSESSTMYRNDDRDFDMNRRY